MRALLNNKPFNTSPLDIREAYSSKWYAIAALSEVVVGLGNVFMRDDGVGVMVAKAIEALGLEGVSVFVEESSDLTLLDVFEGASKVVVVDSIRAGGRPGDIHIRSFTGDVSIEPSLPSLHGLQLHEVLQVAKSTGSLTCPVVVVGIEPRDVSLGQGLSSEVAAAVPKAVETVVRQLGARVEKR
jgi:hydrogenase maturation protease